MPNVFYKDYNQDIFSEIECVICGSMDAHIDDAINERRPLCENCEEDCRILTDEDIASMYPIKYSNPGSTQVANRMKTDTSIRIRNMVLARIYQSYNAGRYESAEDMLIEIERILNY